MTNTFVMFARGVFMKMLTISSKSVVIPAGIQKQTTQGQMMVMPRRCQMIINKDYMSIMRAGKNWTTMEIRKQNDAGMVLGLCMGVALIVLVLGMLIK
jgi:hypothetical protein